MAKIAVIVDSSSYIPADLLKKNKIYVIQDPVIFETNAHTENYWQTQQDFFTDLNAAEKSPTTSQPTPGEITRVFDQVVADGYDSAVIVTLSSGISGTYQTAKNLAENYAGFKQVLVWDAQIAAIGAGNQALYAAGLIKKGLSLEDIETQLGELRSSTGVFFVVDSIKHLQRTGRLSGGQALIAGMLSIKPILDFEDGKIVAAGKARKMTGAWEYIEQHFSQIVEDSLEPLRVNVIDANNPELADEWVEKGQKLWPQVIFERGIIGPYIAVHTGEKSVGFIWGDDYEKLLEKI
ncbi:MAG: DegV family protein [Lactobacillaceae bacterium]|jgi:DegV family protein with EDD domain|nr:DegV family protein [Lactobacillaceae bacterium]